MNLIVILFFCMLGSLGALGLAAVILLVPPKFTSRVIPVLVAYATGTLLAAAFLGMIPQALKHLPAIELMPVILAGILAFFILEKLLLWRHCHDNQCPVHETSGLLILVGDAFHSSLDGVIITATFLTSPTLGIATAFAVIAHEIPHKLGDIMVLLQSGYARRQVLLLNAFSSSSTLLSGLLGFFFLKNVSAALPYVMAISAASFIYIALADLVPGHRRNVSLASTILQLALMLLGIGTIALFRAHVH